MMTRPTRNRAGKTVTTPQNRKAVRRSPPKRDSPSKLEQTIALLTRPGGASLVDLVTATRWQAHSVRGALAGSLKKKGHVIVSEKVDGERRYRIEPAQ
jgi:hypothetical protein